VTPPDKSVNTDAFLRADYLPARKFHMSLLDQFCWRVAGCAAILFSTLAGCGGGSDAPAVPPAPVVSLTGTNFFRDAGQVIVGTPVALAADGPQPGVRWRMAQRPQSSSAQVSTTPAGAAFTPDVPGYYTVEAQVDDGSPTSASTRTTIRALPNQIEFNLSVVNSNGQTALWVRPVNANAPMGGCVVYAPTGCVAPSSVRFFVDRTPFTADTPITTTPDQFMWWHPLDTSFLVGSRHVVRAVVTAPGDPAAAGNRREAIVSFTVSSATQTDPVDGPPTASLDVVGVPALDTASQIGPVWPSGIYVGDTVTLASTTTHVLSGIQPSMRFVDQPAGSAAALTLDQASGTATFVADRVGFYTIESTPVLADGRAGSPGYTTVQMVPHTAIINLYVQDSAIPLFAESDNPKPAPDVTRVYLTATSTRGVSAVVALLDGAPVPPMQIQRFQAGAHGIGGGWYPATVYDIPNSAIATGPHVLTVRLTDSLGRTWESQRPMPTTGYTTQRFDDPNP
jgi:hypothetical protein